MLKFMSCALPNAYHMLKLNCLLFSFISSSIPHIPPTLANIRMADKKKYLSLDIIGQLEDDLESDLLNYDKWMKLIKQVLAKDKEEQVRSVMNKYLNIFKFDGDQWCLYINYEIDRSEFKNVQELFKKCLLAVTTHVGLYRLYVSYVRRVNDVITGGEKARRTVIEAFEFAVKKVGIDLSSSELWEDYLEFLKSWTPTATWEQQQKNDLIRKVYKQLLIIPTDKLEKLWAVYTTWENEVNPITAKKFIGEKSANYMLARSWYTEWSNVTEKGGLQRSPVIPFTLGQQPKLVNKQKDLWYKWLALERENKLELKDEKLVQQRVEYVYKQCITTLPFVPEVWFKYNKFWLTQNEEANINKCIELLAEGLDLNPKSFLLTFQLSELYEKDNSEVKAKEVYTKLLDILIKEHGKLAEKIDSITKNNDNDNNRNTNNDDMEVDKKGGDGSNSDDDDTDYTPDESPLNKLTQAEVENMERLIDQQSDLNKSITYVYNKFMIASKRIGGIKEARSVFKARTTFKSIGYEFYVNNALLEYYSDNKKTAHKIFELGMKLFNKNGGYLLSYLDYLIMTNDVGNMRVLFEQGLTALLKEITTEVDGVPDTSSQSKSYIVQWRHKRKEKDIKEKKEYIKQMFKTFSKFESKYGDLSAVQSLEKRYEQYFPDDDTLELFCDRYYDGASTDEIRKYDLGVDSSKRRKIEIVAAPVSTSTSSTTSKNPSSANSMPANTGLSGINSLPSIPNIPKIPPTPSNISTKSNTSSHAQTELANSNKNNSNNNQSNGQYPPQLQDQFVGGTTYTFLRSLPSSSYFGSTKDHVFDAGKLVELFGHLPNVPGRQ